MTKGFRISEKHVAKRGFHGTDADFEGEVLPPSVHKKSQHFPGFSGDDDTYFLPAEGRSEYTKENERSAWGWADNRGWDANPSKGRYRVHITEPDPEQHIDRNLNNSTPTSERQWSTYARVAPKQKIVDTIWAPAPVESSGITHVNQTLPQVNWHQFGGHNWEQVDNHGVKYPDAAEDYQIRQQRWSTPGYYDPTPVAKAPRLTKGSRLRRRGQLELPLEGGSQ